MRTFIALEISGRTQEALRCAQKAMGRLAGVRWAEASDIHLTLKFIGEIEDSKIPAVFDVMRSVAGTSGPIEFAVRGLGWFPPGRKPRVIWAGVEGNTAALAEIARRLNEGLAQLGVPPETRSFKPHLTLARARGTIDADAIQEAIDRVRKPEFGREFAEELVLFMSTLRPTGAEYTRMGAIAFEKKNEEED